MYTFTMASVSTWRLGGICWHYFLILLSFINTAISWMDCISRIRRGGIHFALFFIHSGRTIWEAKLLSSAPVDPIPATLSGQIPTKVGRLLSTPGMIKPAQLSTHGLHLRGHMRQFSSSRQHRRSEEKEGEKKGVRLTHVSDSGSAHMVSISEKSVTSRIATALCTVRFSNQTALPLIQDNQMKKGDVLGVARVAGIMAAKRTPDLIPLCHPIAISHVTVDLQPNKVDNAIEIRATVTCDGKTGVEMEAMTAASTAALTVYDMCKAVDKGMVIDGVRVVLKDGGKSGRWELD